MTVPRCTCLLALLSLVVALPAFAATGDWVEGEHVRLRLVAAHATAGAPLEAAIELELEPGWKTYWRSPGDAGIPPRFDFSASENAERAAIDFPAPERDDDGFSVSNVYHGRVVLPVRFANSDPARPARLALTADFGVCKDICLPVSLSASLDVPAGDVDAEAVAALAEARAALPGSGQAGVLEIEALRQVGGSDKASEFEVTVATATPDRDLLFVETPPDWYPAAPKVAATGKGEATYRFTVDRKSATTPLFGATIHLTLKSGDTSTTRGFTLGADGTAVAAP